jgi:phosphate transport system substrate-binding protein
MHKNLKAGLAGAIAIVAAAAAMAAFDAATAGDKLEGTVRIDGSSTVFPISEAMAEEFAQEQPKVRVTVGISGTGGGFKKFTVGETDINDASRPIKGVEVEKAAEKGIQFIELPVAFDGLSVVVNPKNDWVDQLTVEELKKIWQPGSTVEKWSDVREGFPDRPIKLYAPGTDSGTFDYFTEAINGKSQACRPDFTASEDDNVLVQGIAGDENALGFFGFAYYVENQSRVKIVPIDGGDGPVAPSTETINNGTYQPLSRPLFIYVSKAAAKRPEVQAFVNFYLESAPELVGQVGYVALPGRVYELAMSRFADGVAGSIFHGKGATVGVTLEELMAGEL